MARREHGQEAPGAVRAEPGSGLEQHPRRVVERANDAYVEVDVDGRITDWNAQAEQTFGWAADEVLGAPLTEVVLPPDARPAHLAAFADMLTRGHDLPDGRRVQLTARHRDGTEFPVELLLSAHRDGGVWRISAFLHDVRQRVAAEREIARQAAFLDAVLDNLAEGVAVCDADGRLVLVNAVLRDRFELVAGQQLPPDWRNDVLMLEADGSTPIPWDRSPLHRALQGQVVSGQVILEGRSAATLRRLVVNARPLLDGDGGPMGALATYLDTTDESARAYARHLEQRHDALTGLPNGRALREHLDLASLEPRPAHLLLVRLDDYRTTLNAAGQQPADAMLVEVARRLRTAASPPALVVRLETDEYAVLVEDGPHDPAVVTERVRRALQEPFRTDAGTHVLSTSAGLARGSAGADLLRQAGVALELARTGRGRWEVYSPALELAVRDALALRADLERALERSEFTLRYQPQVDLRTGTVHGVEALLRWEHPVRGLVRPDEFIPLAEQTGLIRPLGRWVLQTACDQLRAWRDAGLPEIRLAVNLSAEQLEDRLVDDVTAVLRATGLPAGLLELEVTETVAVRPDSAAVAVLTGLGELGLTLSVDDFGTGYSMLGQLRALPFSQLKIDKSFVQELDSGGQAPLVVAMIAMARALGLEVVAEGVETLEQLAFLHGEDCELAQGYLFARPLEPDEVARLLLSDTPLPGFATAVQRPTRPVPVRPRRIADPDELERMVRPLLEQLERLTGLESTYFTRVADGTQEILLARNSGDLEIPQGVRLPWEDTLCSRTLVDGAALVADAAAAFPDVGAVTDLGIVSYVGVPVRTVEGQLYGTLCGASGSRVELDPGLRDMLTLYADLLGERLSRQELQDAERARRQRRSQEQDERALFLREAEHRIRQPLTALTEWAATLALTDDRLEPTARRTALAALRSSADQVGQHLDRLLEEAHSEILRQALQLQPLAVQPWLASLVRPPARAGVQVEAHPATGTVLVDPVALATAMDAVLRVADKAAGPEADLTVSAQAIGSGVEIVVRSSAGTLSDTGDLFAPFPVAGSEPTGSLYSARVLVEAMGGTITAQDRARQGVVLSLWLQAGPGCAA